MHPHFPSVRVSVVCLDVWLFVLWRPLVTLTQFGNTCYCNSVLQALYFCEPFRRCVLDYERQRKYGVSGVKDGAAAGGDGGEHAAFGSDAAAAGGGGGALSRAYAFPAAAAAWAYVAAAAAAVAPLGGGAGWPALAVDGGTVRVTVGGGRLGVAVGRALDDAYAAAVADDA